MSPVVAHGRPWAARERTRMSRREVVDSCCLLQDAVEELLGPLIQKNLIKEEDYRKLSHLAKDVYDNAVALNDDEEVTGVVICLLYTSPSPRDATLSRMPSSA